jgi:transcriptional regulator with XRE-family HTH domain
MTIHARIRERRGALQLSQKQLAEALQVTYQTVQQWETEPDPANPSTLSTAPKRTRLAKVAQVLGVTEEWLLTGRDPEGRLHDPGKSQLEMFYDGMTPEMRHVLLATANTLYNLSNPDAAPGPADPFEKKGR